MKKVQSRGLSVLLAAVMAAGCIGCASKETGREEEGQLPINVQQQDEEPESDSATEKNEFERGEYPEPFLAPSGESYDYEVWKTDRTQVKAPGGILFDGEDVLVCDMGNHCVVRLTTDGDFIESYGELGSDAGNFVTPTAILLHENEIYVLDSGNMRIQVFDADMNYVREIWFEGSSLPSGGKYCDMAIAGDGTIYVAADSSYSKGTSLYYIEEGELCVVSGGVLGYLAEHDGVVYAADKLLYYNYENGYGWKPGENWIYQVDRTGLKKICELPYMYAPVDFVVTDDVMYTLSTVWGKMTQISLDGEILEALFYIEDVQSHDMYLCVQDEDICYVADTQGFLYKVFRTEDE